MEKLLEHPWVRNFVKKRQIRILEICGGAGFGGIALSKILLEQNLDVDLMITDLRKEVLKKAKKWGERVLKKKIFTKIIDAREIYKLRKKFDIVIMYGLSTPHFNPWEIIKVFSGVSECIEDQGIFIIDEADRRYSIFLTRGYQHLLAEGDKNKFVFSFHSGYDILKGTFSRTYFNPIFPEKGVTIELFFWGLTEIGALTFLFFEDVDFIEIGRARYFVLGYKPRRILPPQNLKGPFLFKK